MKIITICGSLRFKSEIIECALNLELKGNLVISPVFSNNEDKDAFSKEDMDMLIKMQKEKIKLADIVYVVDVDGYIGNQTKEEIEFAQSLNKEIIYYSKNKKN